VLRPPAPPALHTPPAHRPEAWRPQSPYHQVDTRVTPPPRHSAGAEWVPPGRDVIVSGVALRGGLLYIGSGLTTVSGGTIEPALIDPSLPVNSRNPDWQGQSMDYWPSYSAISPRARGAYLSWLAGGRDNPNAYIGYVFLYFYGLERRLLVDVANQTAQVAEYGVLVGEIRRLLEIYGDNRSFRRYAEGLLDAAAVLDPAVRCDGPPPAQQAWGWELPMELRIGLAQLAEAGSPVPAAWALAWYGNHPDTHLRTPATRCEEEFRELFAKRYEDRFGEGIVVKPNKARLSTGYYPASSSFRSAVTLTNTALPDVARLTGPVNKLRDLVESVTDDLDAYSRYLGRNPDGARSPAGIALLPEGVTFTPSPEAEKLWSWAASHISEDRRGLASVQELQSLWPTKTGKLAKADAVAVAQLLERRGLGIEPDVRFGGNTPAAGSSVVLFRRASEMVTAPSPQYAAALAIVNLGTLIANADGVVSEPERQALRDLALADLDLSDDERLRLEAHAALVLAKPPTPAILRRRLTALPEDRRTDIGHLLTTIAAADGEISTDEVRTLERLFVTLGLNPDDLYATLHTVATTAIPRSTSDELTSVRIPGKHHAGRAIPRQAPGSPARTGALTLDPERLARTRAESVKVSADLAEIFADPIEEPRPARPTEQPDITPVADLDATHSQLFQLVVTRGSWTRAEFEELTGTLGLLPDGAIDVLNDAAFDAVDEPLCEGQDPIEINQDIVKDMLR
jgi:uncharacterized tellurite resistance protein B-like protein